MKSSSKSSNDLLFHQLIRDNTGCASYIIGSKSSRSCLIVDPLMDIERYDAVLKNQELDVAALIDTHIHADHISGLRFFSQFYKKAEVAIHEKAPVDFPCRKLRDGEGLDYNPSSSTSIKVMHTPGHTTDHICLLIQEEEKDKEGSENVRILLLSGDCLFIGDVGRTDLGRGNNDEMYNSLFHKILKLDPNTEVYPAHIGKKHFLATEKLKTTIESEMKTNPALQVGSKKEFIKYMSEGWPPKPEYYQEIISINLGKSSLLEVQEQIRKSQKESYQRAKKE